MHRQSPAGSGPCMVEGGFLCFQLLRGRWIHCNTLYKERSKVRTLTQATSLR